MQTIKIKNWESKFALTGDVKLNDFTFTLDKESEKSSWVYSRLNLGVDCGEKHGVIYSEMMGGYSTGKSTEIYVHGKTDDGKEDFKNQFTVAWEDRDDEAILETVGDLCFIRIGIERDNKGKLFYKKFLSEYDAIQYLNDNLEDGMTINVYGTLKYSLYNGKTQMTKKINSITLYNKKEDEPVKCKAVFTQSVLLDKNSIDVKELDKTTGELPVHARVLDYVKEIDGYEIKGQYPMEKDFEFQFDLTSQDKFKAIFDKLLKVKKDVTQINFEGDFVESGAVVDITLDDLPDDIKELIEYGVYTEEEALAKCATNGNRQHKMILRRPKISQVGDEDNKEIVVHKYPSMYKEEDLIVDIPVDEDDDEIPFADSVVVSEEDDDWLNNL